LFTVSLNDDAEKRAHQANGGTFEFDFTFLEEQVVKFPTTMGVNGSAFEADGVAYSNEGPKIFANKRTHPSLYCAGTEIIPFEFH
jgi:hypothetical protein